MFHSSQRAFQNSNEIFVTSNLYSFRKTDHHVVDPNIWHTFKIMFLLPSHFLFVAHDSFLTASFKSANFSKQKWSIRDLKSHRVCAQRTQALCTFSKSCLHCLAFEVFWMFHSSRRAFSGPPKHLAYFQNHGSVGLISVSLSVCGVALNV